MFFEETADALLAVDLATSRIVSVNTAMSLMSGWGAADDLVGESVTILTAHEAGEDGFRTRTLDLDLISSPGYYNDVRVTSREGVVRSTTVKVRHVLSPEGGNWALVVISDDTPRQILLRDLTAKHQTLEAAFEDLQRVHGDLQKAQDNMAQAAKLVALGELSAGISHELGQPLTGVRGFAQEIVDILKTKKPSRRITREYAEKIVSNVDKMARLLAHLREFARKEKQSSFLGPDVPVEDVRCREVLDQVLSLLRAQLSKRGIEVRVDGTSNLLARGSTARIEQILINLITNARDAIETAMQKFGGHTGGRGHIRIDLRNFDHFVEIRVQDDGNGMDRATQAKIFDPFFTTKEPGKGLGLGLSISLSLARAMGGDLSVESSSESGTTFVFRLPMADGKAERSKEAA